MRTLRRLSLLGILAVSACMYAPYDEQVVWPFSAVSFEGFATQPSTQITIRAYNNQTSTWDAIGTTTSSTLEVTQNGDTLYPWSTSITFSSLQDWQCYWGNSNCSISGGVATARVRAEQGSQQLPVFDSNGVSCVQDLLDQDVSWLDAGYECAIGTVVRLYWII